MSTAYPLLTSLRDALATVAGVATCKIGLEANMTPADYPMVRIVPSRVANGEVIGRRSVGVLIYFGQPIHEFSSGLEAQWQSLLAMESALLDKAQQTATFVYSETILDEDRNEAYTLLAIRGEVQG
jgi:hypothetical protein